MSSIGWVIIDGVFQFSAGLVVTGSSISIGTTPALSGAVRLPNNQFVSSRNAGNTSDANLIGLDGSNILQLGPAVANAMLGSGVATAKLTFNTSTGPGFSLSSGTFQVLADTGAAALRLITGGSQVQFNGANSSWATGGVNKFALQLNGSTDGQIVAVNGAGTSGVGLDVATDGTLKLRNRSLTAGTGNIDIGGTVSAYNNVATAGYGVGAIRATGRQTAQTGAVGTVCTFTPTADGSFTFTGNILVTTVGTINANYNLTYTDESNAARTLQLVLQLVNGSNVTNVTTAAPYHVVPCCIRVKGGTAITMLTTGTFTGSPVYNVEGNIIQIG